MKSYAFKSPKTHRLIYFFHRISREILTQNFEFPSKNIHYFSALKGITLPETGALKKSASFVATFIKESRNHVNMTNTILMRGEEIIRTVLLCIAGITPRVNVDVFGDVLIAMNAKYPSEFIVWMKILETPSFPTTYIGHEEKVTFMKNIIKYSS